MKIVGLHGGHDSAYAILENGVPVRHNELERFNRQICRRSCWRMG